MKKKGIYALKTTSTTCNKYRRKCRRGQCSTEKKDFITKLSIASKEARETRYWLRLLESQLVKMDYSSYLNSVEHIINILTKTVKSSQEALQKTV
jgi:four helix bundle protein